ncbi:MAG: SET domain-containing protein, partial [Chlamydiales bacterium]
SIQRFEELFEIQYFPHLEFADWKVEQWIRKRCARAYKKGKMGQLNLWLGQLHAKEIEAANIPDITIRWIGEKIGYGLFTNCPIKKWDYIGEYTGLLRRRNLFSPNVNDYCFMYPREWIAFKAYTIDSERQGNYTRFINHSDDPNVESVSVFYAGYFRIILRAIRPIAAHEELTYDYGDIYWRRRKKISEESLSELLPSKEKI